MSPSETNAVVLLSGGFDSVAALRWAQDRYSEVIAVGFDYGQPHKRELEYARHVADAWAHEVDFFIVELGDALRGGFLHEVREHSEDRINPAFVPGRNLVFLSSAASFGASVFDGGFDLVIGSNAADSSFPDCSPEFSRSAAQTLSIALARQIQVRAPWQTMTKAQIWEQADERSRKELAQSWSCYRGGTEPCGTCTACASRKT